MTLIRRSGEASSAAKAAPSSLHSAAIKEEAAEAEVSTPVSLKRQQAQTQRRSEVSQVPQPAHGETRKQLQQPSAPRVQVALQGHGSPSSTAQPAAAAFVTPNKKRKHEASSASDGEAVACTNGGTVRANGERVLQPANAQIQQPRKLHSDVHTPSATRKRQGHVRRSPVKATHLAAPQARTLAGDGCYSSTTGAALDAPQPAAKQPGSNGWDTANAKRARPAGDARQHGTGAGKAAEAAAAHASPQIGQQASMKLQQSALPSRHLTSTQLAAEYSQSPPGAALQGAQGVATTSRATLQSAAAGLAGPATNVASLAQVPADMSTPVVVECWVRGSCALYFRIWALCLL